MKKLYFLLSLYSANALGALTADLNGVVNPYGTRVAPPTTCTSMLSTGNNNITTNGSTPGDVFCVPVNTSGNYRAKITADCTQASPCWLMRDPTDGNTLTAYQQANTDRGWMQRLELNNAKWWYIHQVYLHDFASDGYETANLLEVTNESNDIQMQDSNISGGSIVLVSIKKASRNITIVNSTIHDSFKPPVGTSGQKTRSCIYITPVDGFIGDVSNVRILNNDIWNCTEDGVQAFKNQGAAPLYAATPIYIVGNDAWVDTSLYLNAAMTAYDPNGVLSCSENFLDFKFAGEDGSTNPMTASNITVIANNQVWGSRSTHTPGTTPPVNGVCNNNDAKVAASFQLHELKNIDTVGILFERNFVFDTEGVMNVGTTGPKYISFIDNLIWDAGNKTNNTGSMRIEKAPVFMRATNNTFIQSTGPDFNAGMGFDLDCSLFIATPEHNDFAIGGTTAMQGSVFADSGTAWPGTTNNTVIPITTRTDGATVSLNDYYYSDAGEACDAVNAAGCNIYRATAGGTAGAGTNMDGVCQDVIVDGGVTWKVTHCALSRYIKQRSNPTLIYVPMAKTVATDPDSLRNISCTDTNDSTYGVTGTP